MSFCKVKYCKTPLNHTTPGHKCVCGKYGHGEYECEDNDKIKMLTKYSKDKLLEINYCLFNECKFYWSHKTHNHYCHKCELNHTSNQCVIQSWQVLQTKLPVIKIIKLDEFLNSIDNVYIHFKVDYSKSVIKLNDLFVYRYPINISLADFYFIHSVYIRKKNNLISTLIIDANVKGMHIVYEKFIKDLNNNTLTFTTHINNTLNYKSLTKCPLCRANINRKNSYIIKGSRDKCSVCLENNVEIYFPECEHACICKECYKLIR